MGGGAHRKCQMHEPCRGVYILHSENGKQLQVTTIETTKTNENKSILRLDFSGSTVPGGQLLPCPPPLLATALSHQVSLFILTFLKLAYTP